MSRAAQIIASYMIGRSFYRQHSAEEYLAMAYDELKGRCERAEREADEARKQVDSTVHRIALSFRINSELDVKARLHDPWMWELAIRPLTCFVRMLSEHPRFWERNMLEQIIQQFVRMVEHDLRDRLHDIIEADKKAHPRTSRIAVE